MNVELHINESELNGMEGFVEQLMREARPKVHEAMAVRFKSIWQNNFGPFPEDRPPWSTNYLSERYAKKVKRNVATLLETGALRDSIVSGGYEGESVTIESLSSYAAAHENGIVVPRRPHCPVTDDGELRPYTKDEVIAAAMRALAEELN